MKNLLFVFIVLFLSKVYCFDCGTDPIQNAFTEMIIKIDCPARLDLFNNCCSAHDKCYAAKGGQENCDNIFCQCVQEAGNANAQCQAHGRNFCGMVRSFGSVSYKMGRR